MIRNIERQLATRDGKADAIIDISVAALARLEQDFYGGGGGASVKSVKSSGAESEDEDTSTFEGHCGTVTTAGNALADAAQTFIRVLKLLSVGPGRCL
jgi:hypothetical protein